MENNLTNVNKLQGIVLIMSAHISALHSSSVYIAILFFISLSVHFFPSRTSKAQTVFVYAEFWMRWSTRLQCEFRPQLSCCCTDESCNKLVLCAVERVHTRWAKNIKSISREQFPSSSVNMVITPHHFHGYHLSSASMFHHIKSLLSLAEWAAFHVRCRRYRLIIVQRTNWPLIYSLFPCI